MRERVEVVAPASTANLGPGFDSIGMALNLFTTVRVELAEETRLFFHSDSLAGLPTGDDNLLLQVMQKCFAEQGKELPPLHVHVWSDIPLTRGLGSSAAALAAGLVASNALLGEVYSSEDLVQLGTAWEGHPDNIGASLLGGVVIGSWDGQHASVVRVESPPLDVVVAVPQFELPTKRARSALPEKIPFKDAVLSSSKANVLTAALITGRWDLLDAAMRDLLHQPYRAQFIPGMTDILNTARDHGALGIALSGAGPTLLAFTREKTKLTRYLKDAFTRYGVPVSILHLKPWDTGAVVRLTEPRQTCTVLRKRDNRPITTSEGASS